MLARPFPRTRGTPRLSPRLATAAPHPLSAQEPLARRSLHRKSLSPFHASGRTRPLLGSKPQIRLVRSATTVALAPEQLGFPDGPESEPCNCTSTAVGTHTIPSASLAIGSNHSNRSTVT